MNKKQAFAYIKAKFKSGNAKSKGISTIFTCTQERTFKKFSEAAMVVGGKVWEGLEYYPTKRGCFAPIKRHVWVGFIPDQNNENLNFIYVKKSRKTI